MYAVVFFVCSYPTNCVASTAGVLGTVGFSLYFVLLLYNNVHCKGPQFIL